MPDDPQAEQPALSIYARLIEARKNFGTIVKRHEAQIGQRKYKYANLDDILDAVLPALGDQGILLLQQTEVVEAGTMLHTRLIAVNAIYKPDHAIVESQLLIPDQQNPQAFGSALTYARRQEIETLLCISASEDDDAASAAKQKPSQAREPEPRVKTPRVSGQFVIQGNKGSQTFHSVQEYMDYWETLIKDLSREALDRMVELNRERFEMLMATDAQPFMTDLMGKLQAALEVTEGD